MSRYVVVWIKRHVRVNEELRKMQLKEGVAEVKLLKPILDVKTRWNSTFNMQERVIKLLPFLTRILLHSSDLMIMISSAEKREITEIITFLRPLEAMTAQISGEKYSTLSEIIPLVHCGRDQIEQIRCETLPGT